MMSARPPAALALAAIALAAPLLPLLPPPAAAQSEPDPVRLFEEGVAQFNQGRFHEAIEVFRAVFELDPNPFVLFNIGRCYEELGDADAAVRYYQRALSLEGFPRDARLEAITRLERLEPMLERKDREAALTMARSATSLGALSAEREAAQEGLALLQAREAQEEPPPLPALPPMPPPAPTRGALSWTGLGVAGFGLASLGTGLAFTLGISDDLDQQQALRQEYLDLRQRALGGEVVLAPQALRAGQDANALADDIEHQQITAGIFLGVGALCVIGGLVLFAVDTPEAAPTQTITLDLWFAPQRAGLQARW